MKISKFIFCCIAAVAAMACSKQETGYMQTGNAVYIPNEMDIRLILDENLDAYRIYNVAPWVSPKLQGVIGTNPMTYAIEKVESPDGDAEMFRALLTIRGGGHMEFPLVSDIPVGEYIVSVRVSNEGHSHVLNNIFTFHVKEK